MTCQYVFKGESYSRPEIIKKIQDENLHIIGNKMAAGKWLKEKLGDDQIVQWVSTLIDGRSFGQFQKDGTILLSELFEKGTEYHEAFHRVWQTFLSPQERKAILAELNNVNLDGVRKLYPRLGVEKLKEEYLAEAFREYVLNNGDILFPEKTKSFFQTLLDFLKKLFGQKPLDMKELFRKINEGEYRNAKVSYPVVLTPMNRIADFDIDESSEIVRSIATRFLEKLFAGQQAFQKFVKNEIPQSILIENLFSKTHQSAFRQTVEEIFQTNRELAKKVWENNKAVRVEVEKYLKSFNIDINTPDEWDAAQEEVGAKDSINDKPAFLTDDKSRFSQLVKLLLASIPANTWIDVTKFLPEKNRNVSVILPDGSEAKTIYDGTSWKGLSVTPVKWSYKSPKLGITINSDWTALSSKLAKRLAGKAISTTNLFRELEALSEKNPEFKTLLDVLGGTNEEFYAKFTQHPNYQSILNGHRIVGDDGKELPPDKVHPMLEKFNLRQQFHNAFTKHYYEFYNTSIKQNGQIWTYDSNLDSKEKFLTNQYKGKVQSDIQKIELWIKNNPDSTLEGIYDAYKNWKVIGREVFGNENHLADFGLNPANEKGKEIVEKITTHWSHERGLKEANDFDGLYNQFSNWLKQLAATELEYKSETELGVININGDRVYPVNLHTFQTITLDSLNYYATLSKDSLEKEINDLLEEGLITDEDLIEAEKVIEETEDDVKKRMTKRALVIKARLPFLFNAYTQNSIWLNQILEKGKVPTMTIYDGLSPENQVDGKPLADVDPTDLFATFMAGLYTKEGYGTTIVYPAFKHSDRSVFYGYKFDTSKVVEPVKSIEDEFVAVYKGYLEDQKNLTEAYHNASKESKENGLYTNVAHFNPDKKQLLPFVDETGIKRIFDEQVQLLKDKLAYNGNLKMVDGRPVGFSTELWEASDKDIDRALKYIVKESFIGFMEQTKLFTGDPGFYSSAANFFKRMNTQSSTGTPATVDKLTNTVVDYMNKVTEVYHGVEYGKVHNKKADGRIREIIGKEKGDYVSPISDVIYNKYLEYGKKLNVANPEEYAQRFKDAYSEINENDGQSLINLFAWREFYTRIEGWNSALQKMFDIEMRVLNGETSEIFDEIFNEWLPLYAPQTNKTLDWWKQNPDKVIETYWNKFVEPFRVIKGQYMGPVYVKNNTGSNVDGDEMSRVFIPGIRKTSYLPLMPSMIMGTNLEKLNKLMLDYGLDMFHMGSGAKVGTNKDIDIYDENGNFVLDKTYIESLDDNFNTPYGSELDYRFMKNQVKISGKEKNKIIVATQARKNMLQNFKREDGTWVDEAVAMEYIELHRQVVYKVLEEIDELLGKDRKGFVEEVKKSLKDEPENVFNALAKLEEEGYIEQLPIKNKLENILFSMIGKNGVKIKATGNSAIQAAVTMFESGARKTSKKEVKYRIPMNFEDGTGGRKMRPEFSGKSTLELIQEGKRKATSRDRSKSYNQQDIQVGDVIEFYSESGKSKGQSVKVIVTKAPYKLDEVTSEEWSKLEGWSPERYETLKNQGYEQFQFELLNDSDSKGKVYASEELRTYLDKDGNIQEAEIMMPLPQQWIPKLLKHYGTHDLFKAIETLNKEMVEGKWKNNVTFKGLRIPNQQVSSNDIFVVKKFFLPTVSNMVVVPADIVVKTGSDFDVDKMNLYMPNLDAEFEYIDYNRTVEEDYIDYVREKNIEDSTIAEKVKKEFEATSGRSWGAYKSRISKLKTESKNTKKELVSEFWGDFKTFPKVLQQSIKNAMNVTGEEAPFIEKLGNAYAILGVEIAEFQNGKPLGNELSDFSHLQLLLTEYTFAQAIIKDYTEELMALEENRQETIESIIKRSQERNKEIWSNLAFEIAKQKAEHYGIESFDEFSNKSEIERKSIKQIENRLIQVEREILLHQDNFYQTLATIDDKLLKENVYKDLQTSLENSSYKSFGSVVKNIKDFKDKSAMKFFDILNLPQQVQVKVNAVDSKIGVGVVATEITGHTMFQVNNVTVNKTIQVGEKTIETKIFSVGDDKYALDSVYDTEGNLITENLSVVLTSQVDAAKADYAPRININKNTLPVLTYMLRRGESLRNVMFFLNQPIIHEYLRRLNVNNSLLYRALDKQEGNNLRQGTEDILEDTKKTVPNKIVEGLGYKENLEQAANQHEMLQRFFDIQEQGNIMLKYKQGNSADTDVPKNMADLENSKKERKKADEAKLLIGAEKVRQQGLLQPFFDVQRRLEELKKYYFMYQIPNYTETIEAISQHLYKKDDKQQMLDKLNSDFALYLIQNLPEVNGAYEKLFKSDNNIGIRVLEAAKKYDNQFLTTLASKVKLKEQDKKGWENIPSIKFIQPKDPFALNTMIEHFQAVELLDKELYDDLIMASLLQSSINPSPFSWLAVFPNQGYDLELFEKAFNKEHANPKTLDFENYLTAFFFNNPKYVPQSLKRLSEDNWFKKRGMSKKWNKDLGVWDIMFDGKPIPSKGTYHLKNYKASKPLHKTEVTKSTAKNEDSRKNVKTYSGLITKLAPNQVFVFGSNPVGINGNPTKGTGGAALVATKNEWVKQNEKMDNRLSDSGKSWGLTTVAYPGQKKSKTPEQIKQGIAKLYEYAKANPIKELLVAYTGTGTNLNGYSNKELAEMFSSFPIPPNVVFEEQFATLLTDSNKNENSRRIDEKSINENPIITSYKISKNKESVVRKTSEGLIKDEGVKIQIDSHPKLEIYSLKIVDSWVVIEAKTGLAISPPAYIKNTQKDSVAYAIQYLNTAYLNRNKGNGLELLKRIGLVENKDQKESCTISGI